MSLQVGQRVVRVAKDLTIDRGINVGREGTVDSVVSSEQPYVVIRWDETEERSGIRLGYNVRPGQSLYWADVFEVEEPNEWEGNLELL